MDSNSKNFNYPAQFGLLIGLTGTGLIIGNLLSFLTWMVMTGRPVTDIATHMFDPGNFYTIMIMQVVATCFMFLLPVMVLARIAYRKPGRFLGMNSNFNLRQVLIILIILVLTFPLSGVLAEINQMLPIPNTWAVHFKEMEAQRTQQESAMIQISTFPRYLISMIIIALLPGLFEEMGFRAGLQNVLTRWFKGPVIAILLTSILFSAAHFSYYGFLVRVALGVILGLIFYFSGNLWLGVLFHFLYNGLQVTALYLYTASGSKGSKDIEQNFPLWTGVVALFLIIVLLDYFRKISREQKQRLREPEGSGDDFLNWVTPKS
jgi:membrane protease YdiL (CAAX protease family)